MPKPTGNFKKLLDSNIKEITRNARSGPNRQHVPWFHRGEVLTHLGKALKHGATEIILDGILFNIRYDGDKVIVSPADGTYTPCAHLSLRRYVREWDAYEQATRVTRLPKD